MARQPHGNEGGGGMKPETIKKVSENLSAIRYGIVAVSFQVHDGRVTAVTHSVTENSREGSK
jgi:hypothetical protein